MGCCQSKEGEESIISKDIELSDASVSIKKSNKYDVNDVSIDCDTEDDEANCNSKKDKKKKKKKKHEDSDNEEFDESGERIPKKEKKKKKKKIKDMESDLVEDGEQLLSPKQEKKKKKKKSEDFDEYSNDKDRESKKEKKKKKRHSSIDDDIDSSDRPAVPGKEGWLYRENTMVDLSNPKAYLKYWVSVSENRLVYRLTEPNNQTASSANSSTLMPATSDTKDLPVGYFYLKEDTTHCAKRLMDKVKGNSLHASLPKTIGKYCFTVKDKDISGVFACASDKEREEWMSVINAAISGVRHVLLAPAASVAEGERMRTISGNEVTISSRGRAPPPPSAGLSKSSEIIDMPRKLGPLKKKAIGGRFGIKTVKNRYFKLDGGEFSYFVDEDMRPSKLKGTVNLVNAKVITSDNDKAIVVELEGEDAYLEMEAPSAKVALEWNNALKQTIYNLALSGGKSGKKRRVNLANEGTDTGSMDGAGKSSSGWSGEISNIEVVEKSRQTVEVIKGALKTHFLLGSITNFDPLIKALHFEAVLPGDVIIHQGTKGDLFYILEVGSADAEKDGNSVGSVGSGKAFGELALLNNVARSATIRATHVCKLWTLDRKTFRAVLARQDKESKEERINFLKQVKLLEQLSPSSISKIADVLTLATFAPGERIIKQGDHGDRFYMIQSGKVSVTKSTFTSTKELVVLGAGGAFGELALMSNEPRKATVTAKTTTSCWTMDRNTFTSMLGNMSDAIDESIGIGILRNVKLLKDLNDRQLSIISRSLQKEKYSVGDVIIQQGEAGDHFYMIESGEVSVSVNHVEVAKLNEGSFFGEQALLKNEVRSATVTASSDTTCLLLTRNDFTRLLGPLDSLIQAEAEKRTASAAKAKLNKGFSLFNLLSGPMDEAEEEDLINPRKRAATGANADKELAAQRRGMLRQASAAGLELLDKFGADYRLDQFASVQLLYDGQFSSIKMVQHSNGRTFALKIFKKQALFENNIERAPVNEKELLAIFDFPFICGMYATFKDQNALYILQELLPGGDFWSLLYSDVIRFTKPSSSSSMQGLTIKDSMFYIVTVITILLHIHEHDVAYRDLKPENLVVDQTGYIKIVDFGNAKFLPAPHMTNTMCGSPEYVAPEMVLARDHNHSVDYWSLGILIYEMLTKTTPFEHDNASMVYQSIIDCTEVLKLQFSTKPDFDVNAKDFIVKLLSENPAMRLGMLRNGTNDLWEHPFIKKSGYTSQNVLQRALKPPYVPECDGPLRCCNFEEFDVVDVPIPTYTGTNEYKTF